MAYKKQIKHNSAHTSYIGDLKYRSMNHFFKGFVCKECEDSLSHRVRRMTKTCPEEQRQEGRDVFFHFL